MNLNIFTNGGVISPGAPILDIVPLDARLIIEARVDPVDIDVVHKGLTAEIRLASFRADEVPVIKGVVENISPDSIKDEKTGEDYYAVRIVPLDAEEKLKGVVLTPGMPAEAAEPILWRCLFCTSEGRPGRLRRLR